MDKINIEYRNPNDLIPYPLNAKKHPVEQINHIASSIYEFGFDQPIVIDRKGMIIKGHGRYLASLKLGLQSVPVIVANLSDAMAKASRLADNKVAESDWDNDLLRSSIDSLLETIGSDDIDLQSFGFDMSVFDDLIQSEVIEKQSNNYSTVRENKVYDNDDIENVGSDSYENPTTLTWENAASKIPSGDKSLFSQKTFTIHDSQLSEIDKALKIAKETNSNIKIDINDNSNGNALYFVCKFYLENN